MAVGIVTYEILARPGELLSEGIDRSLERAPWATRLGVLAVAAHLLNWLPPKYDPIHILATNLTVRVGVLRYRPEDGPQGDSGPGMGIVVSMGGT